MKYLNLLVLLILIIPISLISQISIPNKIIPLKIDEEISVDGYLKEKCWQEATKIENFTQREPISGAKPSELTQVAICYTSTKLYIGVWCYDKDPNSIVRKGMKRDFEDWRDDNFRFVLDPFNDKTSGFLFTINPNGARKDAIISRIEEMNTSWNGIWDVATTITNEGWFAEIELPFSTLKFPKSSKNVFGINFERNIRHKVEQVRWQGWSLDNSFDNLLSEGEIDTLYGINGQENIILKPYLLGGLGFQQESSVQKITKIGGDIIIPFSSNVSLSGTINTDFAQVESDQLQVNITRFSKYYPEKRDFFLENKNLFSFRISDGDNIFYSRNIGIENGVLSPIIAGIKLTGKLDNTNFGIMSIQTDKQNTTPTTNFTVARAVHNFSQNITLGGILTAKNLENHSNYVYGADFNYSTNELFGDKNFIFYGSFSQSQTSNYDNTNNSSLTAYLSYPNNFVNSDLLFNQYEVNYYPEMGYLQRGNIKHLFYNLEFKPRFKGIEPIKNLYIVPARINTYWTDETNSLETLEMEFIPIGFSFETGDFIMFKFDRNFDRLSSDFELSDNFIFKKGEYWYNNYGIEIDTYGGRQLTSWFGINYGDYYDANYFSFDSYLQFSPSSNLSLSGSYEINRLKKNNLEYSTNQIATRIEYSFNPKLYTSIYAQWNDQINNVILNFRVQWIPVVGSDVYFVINQILSTDSSKVQFQDNSYMLKIVWRFAK
ncbi:MAG: DUF5916 domain-containing protein [Candidatus Kapaibacteriota bacterium]